MNAICGFAPTPSDRADDAARRHPRDCTAHADPSPLLESIISVSPWGLGADLADAYDSVCFRVL